MEAKSVVWAFLFAVFAGIAQASIDTGEIDGVIPETLAEAKSAGYVHLSQKTTATTDPSQCEFTAAAKWRNADDSQADAPSTANKYYVAPGTSYVLYTPNKAGVYAFPDTTLVIGGYLQSLVKTSADSTGRVSRVHFVYGTGSNPVIRYQANKGPFFGKAYVHTTTAHPLEIRWDCDNTQDQAQSIQFDFFGDPTASICTLIPAGRFTKAPKYYKATLKFLGDLSGYRGRFLVYSNVVTAVNGPVALSSVDLMQDARFRFLNAAENTVGDLTFRAGADGLVYDVVDGEVAKLTVTNDYVQSGTVDLDVPLALKGNVASPAKTWTLLELAEGATGTLDPAKFTVSGVTYAENSGGLPKCTLDLSEDGRSLGFSRREIVALQISSDASKTSPLECAQNSEGTDYWSDHAAPQAGRDYLDVGYTVYGPFSAAAKGADVVFPGESLTLIGGALYGAQTAEASLFFKELTFAPKVLDGKTSNSSLRCWGGGVTRNYGAEIGSHATHTIKGRICLLDDSAEVSCIAYNGACYRLEAEITGEATLSCRGLEGAKSTPKGCIELAGLNTNYMGKIVVSIKSKAHTGDDPSMYPETPSLTQCATLIVSDERNLGGRLTSFTYNALTIQQMCILAAASDMTVSAANNRGILVSNVGRMLVPQDVTLAVDTPITYKGVLRKEGKGLLTLGGKALFRDGKDATAPLAGTNELQVIAGSVKPTSTNCLDGVKMTFAAGTKLVYDLDPAGEGMKEFGPVNVKEPDGTPLAMGEGVASVPVEFAGDLTKLPLETTLALGTFASDEIANAVRGKLAIVRPKGYQVALSVNDNHTLVATLAHKGAVLLIK